jgi:hypothetical protein
VNQKEKQKARTILKGLQYFLPPALIEPARPRSRRRMGMRARFTGPVEE